MVVTAWFCSRMGSRRFYRLRLTVVVKESACDASMQSSLEMYGITPYIRRWIDVSTRVR